MEQSKTNLLSSKIILMGLPESGKTSFLAALMYFVESPVKYKNLEQYKLSSNAAYVNAIVQAWLKGNKQERTKISAAKTAKTEAEIYLRNLSTKKELTLYIPDFYGETFENQFLDRQIETDYIEQIHESRGVMLFIHPEKIKHAILIEDVKDAKKIAEMIDRQFHADTGEAGRNAQPLSGEGAAPFVKEEIPTQVVVSDLLEAHIENANAYPIVLAVVISAWDLIIKDGNKISPLKWIEKNIPLLYQFLLTNDNKISFRAFGISAQGGNVDNKDERNRLQNLDEPADRLIVQEEEQLHKNIASPIEWIIDQWK